MTNADRCPECGLAYAMVGRAHLCRGRPVPRVEVVKKAEAAPPPKKEDRGDPEKPKGKKKAKRAPKGGGSYKYRDPEKWRAYMRELMRRRRKKKNDR